MRKKERYEKVIAWFQANVPVAETELHYNNPVSYTHLDVYKRQPHAIISKTLTL